MRENNVSIVPNLRAFYKHGESSELPESRIPMNLQKTAFRSSKPKEQAMSDRDILITSIRDQREILDNLLFTLESRAGLGAREYALCEQTTAEVGKGLERVRSFSIERFVTEKLWGSELRPAV